jgi:hypothetical protein
MFNNRNGGSPKDYSQVSLDDFSSDDDDSHFGDEYGEGDFVEQSIRNQRVSIGCVQSFSVFLVATNNNHCFLPTTKNSIHFMIMSFRSKTNFKT